MRRAEDLKPGDVTPHFVVGVIEPAVGLEPLLAGNGELAILPQGERKAGGPRFLVAPGQLIEVTGCTRCGTDHVEDDCPRRSLAPSVRPRKDESNHDAEYVAARMRAEPTGA